MATVQIGSLIHRVDVETEQNADDVPVTTVRWQSGIPVCICGEDLTDTPTSRVTTDYRYREFVECMFCGTQYQIQGDK